MRNRLIRIYATSMLLGSLKTEYVSFGYFMEKFQRIFETDDVYNIINFDNIDISEKRTSSNYIDLTRNDIEMYYTDNNGNLLISKDDVEKLLYFIYVENNINHFHFKNIPYSIIDNGIFHHNILNHVKEAMESDIAKRYISDITIKNNIDLLDNI